MKPEPRIESLNGQIAQVVSRSIVLVGRHPDCDLHLNHPCVSRRHCCIVLSDNVLYIRDLGSRHGVWVNGEPVNEQKLKHDDQIAVGTYYFRVVLTTEVPAEVEKKPDLNILTDLETKIPEPITASLKEVESSPTNNEMHENLDHSMIEATEQLQSLEVLANERSSDLLDRLEMIEPENADSGYEPVFDLKL